MCTSNDGGYILFFLSFFLFRVDAFHSLVQRSDGYLRGKRKRISFTFYLSAFLLADVVVIICVHRRSSILPFRSKVVVMRFFSRIRLVCVLFLLSLSLVRVCARASIRSFELRSILNGTILLRSELFLGLYISLCLIIKSMRITMKRKEKGNRKESDLGG